MTDGQTVVEDVDISERLRLLMAVRKMSVAEMAASAGVSKSAMEKYLAGPSSPRATAIVSLCVNLGVSADWMLLAKPDEDRYVVRGAVTAAMVALLQELKQAGPLSERFLTLDAVSPEWRMFCWETGDQRALDVLAQLDTERRKRIKEGSFIAVGNPIPFDPKS